MKMKIIVRKGDKGGGGGDFEVQVFSTALAQRPWYRTTLVDTGEPREKDKT
jgi:hypothetical protein